MILRYYLEFYYIFRYLFFSLIFIKYNLSWAWNVGGVGIALVAGLGDAADDEFAA